LTIPKSHLSQKALQIIAVFIIGTIGGIFADQIFWPYFVEKPLFYKYRLEQAPVYVTEKKEITIEENTALEEAVEKVGKTVVTIKTKTATGKTLEGCGLIVSSDGLIVTFNDLLPSKSNTILFWEGRSLSFQIIKRDQKENLALLQVEKKNLPTIGFADPDKTRLGERVFLVAMILNKEITSKQANGPLKIVNEGIIKSFSGDYLLTNIVEKGNIKGSPLFNITGEAIGLNLTDAEGKVSPLSIRKIKTFIGL